MCSVQTGLPPSAFPTSMESKRGLSGQSQGTTGREPLTSWRNEVPVLTLADPELLWAWPLRGLALSPPTDAEHMGIHLGLMPCGLEGPLWSQDPGFDPTAPH